MAGTNDHHGISASPNSSEEVESLHGTPATKISAFSPDDVREEIKIPVHGIVRSKVPPAFVLSHAQSNFSPKGKAGHAATFGSQDPFISASTLTATTRSSTDASKLSPIASSFTPATFFGSVSSKGVSSPFDLPLSAPIIHDGVTSLSFLIPPPVHNASQTDTTCQKDALSSLSDPIFSPTSLPPADPTSNGPFTNVKPLKLGRFSSDDGTSRSLMISQVARNTPATDINDFFDPNVFVSLSHVVLSDLAAAGTVYVKFADIRDADKIYSKAQTAHEKWSVRHIGPRHFVMKYQPESLKYTPVSMYEGQVLITADFAGPRQRFDAGSIGFLIKELLQNYGDVMAYEVGMIRMPVATYRAEYYDVTAVQNALSNLNGFKIGSCTLSIAHYKPDLEGTTQRPSKNPGPLIIGQEDTSLESALGSMSVDDQNDIHGLGTSMYPLLSPYPYSTQASKPISFRKDLGGQHTPSSLSNYGFTSGKSDQSPSWSPTYNPYSNYGLPSPIWSSYSPGAIGQERGAPPLPQQRQGLFQQQQRGQGRTGARQYHDYASGHHNVVDVDRIRQGTDVRTTIMLRNIPNKIDQAMLKDIVDETSLGKYDFMYLRIDFANNCNVGYAFINFEDPYFIIDFVNARAGHRWNRYNSDKVAEVSYATIQGRDCLVQKFRNSSVMLEHPSFRPKIFHTGTGPMAGTEDKFPGPDNPSKMRRSVENAEHVGLFAPRAGQNFRDEQRRRRSQYDRGTRLAEIEDSYEVEHHDYRGETNSFHAGGPYGRLRESYNPGYGVSSF